MIRILFYPRVSLKSRTRTRRRLWTIKRVKRVGMKLKEMIELKDQEMRTIETKIIETRFTETRITETRTTETNLTETKVTGMTTTEMKPIPEPIRQETKTKLLLLVNTKTLDLTARPNVQRVNLSCEPHCSETCRNL